MMESTAMLWAGLDSGKTLLVHLCWESNRDTQLHGQKRRLERTVQSQHENLLVVDQTYG